MLVELRNSFFENVREYLLVNQCTHHIRIVVKWHHALDNLAEHPKCLLKCLVLLSAYLFTHYSDKSPNDEVESLTVANGRIPYRVGSANIFDALHNLGTLVVLFILKCPRQIHFDLVEVRVWKLLIIIRDQGLIAI